VEGWQFVQQIDGVVYRVTENPLQHKKTNVEVKPMSFDNFTDWHSRDLVVLLENLTSKKHIAAGHDLITARKVSELHVTAGCVSVRVTMTTREIVTPKLIFPILSQGAWDLIETLVAANAWFYSALVEKRLPVELNQTLEQIGVSIFPSSLGDISEECNCGFHQPCVHMMALWHKLFDTLKNEPTIIFRIAGRTLDSELKRIEILRGLSQQRILKHRATPEPVKSIPMSYDEFYHIKNSQELNYPYRLKADALPALILRSTPTAIPIESSNFNESDLEDAYLTVARRAQVLGIRFK